MGGAIPPTAYFLGPGAAYNLFVFLINIYLLYYSVYYTNNK